MSRSEPTSQLQAVLKAVANEPNGATLIDVAAQLSPPAPQRNVQRWLAVLVRQNRIVRVGDARSSRYKLCGGAEVSDAPAASDVGQAIWRLVTQPLNERMPCGYHRDWLDGYRPNRTCFIPEPIRARLRASIATPPVRAWRDPDHFNVLATEAAWSSSCLEAELADGRPPSFSRADVTAWLTAPESANARPEVQFVRNQRAAWQVLLGRGPDVGLTYELLTLLHRTLTQPATSNGTAAVPQPARDPTRPRRVGERAVSGSRQTRGPEWVRRLLSADTPLLRTQALALAQTAYRPPAEPWVIETCLNQILGWAPAIADPIEQAFFGFVHLLYLQPFASLNASMACLAVNIPLSRAGLPPVTFAGIRSADLLDGMRGVWELNRTELLRDVFVAAYEDCHGMRVAGSG